MSQEDDPSCAIDFSAICTEANAKAKTDLVQTLSVGFAYWWPANAIIFKFIPTLLRPVGMSLFSVVWGCYLSLVQYKKEPDEPKEK